MAKTEQKIVYFCDHKVEEVNNLLEEGWKVINMSSCWSRTSGCIMAYVALERTIEK